MADKTNIEWADATFNPWIGCTKVSPGCDHCYAEELDKRRQKLWGGLHWGPGVPRRLASDSTWNGPRAWDNKQRKHEVICAERGVAPMTRPRVFCASLADVFDPEVQKDWRTALWGLIRETPHLDWLLLTKRPQMIGRMLPDYVERANIWLGTTVENQDQVAKRVPHLLAHKAAVHFLSVEPMLGQVSVGISLGSIGWVICGGESGPGKRPFDPAWARHLRNQCQGFKVPFFMKQMDKVQPIPADLMVRELPHGR